MRWLIYASEGSAGLACQTPPRSAARVAIKDFDRKDARYVSKS